MGRPERYWRTPSSGDAKRRHRLRRQELIHRSPHLDARLTPTLAPALALTLSLSISISISLALALTVALALTLTVALAMTLTLTLTPILTQAVALPRCLTRTP